MKRARHEQSAKKGPFVNEKLFRKVQKLNDNRAKQPIRTWRRACTIIPEFVGHTFEVHNGNKFLKVFVQEGHGRTQARRVSPTRMFRGHSRSQRPPRPPGAAPPAAPAPART
jgi:small subunit ribosomal protein S19